MQSIAVSELRANLMNVLKTIERGSSLDITSRGKIIAKLVPPDDSREKAKHVLGKLRKTARIHDIISPISDEWKVDS